MKIKVEKFYEYDISLGDHIKGFVPGIGYVNTFPVNSVWEEMDVTNEELVELINKGEHIKINC